MRVLLDTHIWVRWLLAEPALTAAMTAALDRAARRHEVCISAISLCEVQMLHAKKRLELPIRLGEWLRAATHDAICTVLPLDVEVVATLEGLPPAFHGDPADRIIVATARAHALPLATYDKAIRRARLTRLWAPKE